MNEVKFKGSPELGYASLGQICEYVEGHGFARTIALENVRETIPQSKRINEFSDTVFGEMLSQSIGKVNRVGKQGEFIKQLSVSRSYELGKTTEDANLLVNLDFVRALINQKELIMRPFNPAIFEHSTNVIINEFIDDRCAYLLDD